jgi:hypothetical protein
MFLIKLFPQNFTWFSIQVNNQDYAPKLTEKMKIQNYCNLRVINLQTRTFNLQLFPNIDHWTLVAVQLFKNENHFTSLVLYEDKWYSYDNMRTTNQFSPISELPGTDPNMVITLFYISSLPQDSRKPISMIVPFSPLPPIMSYDLSSLATQRVTYKTDDDLWKFLQDSPDDYSGDVIVFSSPAYMTQMTAIPNPELNVLYKGYIYDPSLIIRPLSVDPSSSTPVTITHATISPQSNVPVQRVDSFQRAISPCVYRRYMIVQDSITEKKTLAFLQRYHLACYITLCYAQDPSTIVLPPPPASQKPRKPHKKTTNTEKKKKKKNKKNKKNKNNKKKSSKSKTIEENKLPGGDGVLDNIPLNVQLVDVSSLRQLVP